MAKYLIFSDVHANLAAMEAVLNGAASVDGYIFLGDIVSFGPQPLECVQLLSKLNPIAVLGNHDKDILRLCNSNQNGENNTLSWNRWTAQQLDCQAVAFLKGLDAYVKEIINGKSCLMMHSFGQLEELFEIETLCEVFLAGHSHHALEVKIGSKYFINPGSVSQQRDGCPDASFAIWSDSGFSFYRKNMILQKC